MARSARERRLQRKNRSRAKISGTKERPRLVVYRSNKNLSLQLIDDQAGSTIVSASTGELKSSKKTKTEQAAQVGILLAEKAKKAKVKAAVFDRSSYRYHGRVKAAAEGARKGGLKM